jgi:hypothetical protein
MKRVIMFTQVRNPFHSSFPYRSRSEKNGQTGTARFQVDTRSGHHTLAEVSPDTDDSIRIPSSEKK